MLVAVIIAYLIGSIPFGYLIVRATAGADVRQTGSGGTGATNVTRSAGKAAGVITLVLDALKGVLAIVVATYLASGEYTDWVIAAAAIAVLLGHIFPVWLRFRGGKGVATGVGVFLALSPLVVLCAAVIFVVVIWLTRFVSLGSILAAATMPLFVWLQSVFVAHVGDLKPLLTVAVVGALLIVFAHRGNITRLWNGTEPRITDLKR